MTWTFCTSGAAIVKAGANANSTIVASGAVLADWSDEAESIICDIARDDLVTDFASLTANGKQILQNMSSALVAQKIIMYDMSGYTSRTESVTMLNILENDITRGIRLIKEGKAKRYLGAT
jgi:hypothetical protein